MAPHIASDTIYIGIGVNSDGGGGSLVAVNPVTGNVKWSHWTSSGNPQAACLS